MGFSIGAAVFAVVSGIVGGVAANFLTEGRTDKLGKRGRIALVVAVGLAIPTGILAAKSQVAGGHSSEEADGRTSVPSSGSAVNTPTVEGVSATALTTLLGTPVDGSQVQGTTHPGASVWRLAGKGCESASVDQNVTVTDAQHRARFTLALADSTPAGISVDVSVALGSDKSQHVLRAGQSAVIDVSARAVSLSVSLRTLTSVAAACDERPIEVVLFDATLT